MIEVQFPDTWLLTVEELVAYLTLTDADAEKHRVRHIQAVRQASADVIAYLKRLPLPHVRTLEFDAPRTRFLTIEADLLEVAELLNTKGEVLASTDYRLKPLNTFPKRIIELTKQGCSGFQSWCGTQPSTMALTGQFGYAPHWQYAWEAIAEVELDASEDTLTLTDVSGIGVGDTLRMDDEYLFVRAKAITTAPAGTLTLRRGVLGSTAAAHEANTPIERFLLLDVIHSNAIEWAAHLEKSRGRVGERVQVSEQGLLVVNDLSPLVKEALDPHVYNPTVQLP